MRRILSLSLGLGLLLIALYFAQRAFIQLVTNRPFLGVWNTGRIGTRSGLPARLEIERGGVAWITLSGQPRRRIAWSEGPSPHELRFQGHDPARPNGQEACRWFVNGRHLMLFPIRPPGRSAAPSTLPYNLERVRHASPMAEQRLLGAWENYPVPRVFTGTWGTFRRPHLEVDVRPGGVLRLREDGNAWHEGHWELNATVDGFDLICTDSTPPQTVWILPLAPEETTPAAAVSGGGAMLTGGRRIWFDDGRLWRVLPARETVHRPFIGRWDSPKDDRHQRMGLEFRPGGELWVEDGGQRRHGAWEEHPRWPVLILTGLNTRNPNSRVYRTWQIGHLRTGHDVKGRSPETLFLIDRGAPNLGLDPLAILRLERVNGPDSQSHGPMKRQRLALKAR